MITAVWRIGYRRVRLPPPPLPTREYIYERRIDMTSRDMRLFEILKDHTIKNAREIAHDIWKDGDEDGIHDDLIAAINRCENGTGTDADWDMLIEQTEM